MRTGLLPRLPDQAPAWTPCGEPLAETRDVTVHLGGRRVLDAVSLAVVAGRLVALVGPNGAGKSTLLSVIAGDIRPGFGEVLVGGKVRADWQVAELALMRTLLPQQPAVSFGFSVQSVVEMARAPWSNTPESVNDPAIVMRAMVDADIRQFAARRFVSLSGGEKARASLARALAQQTQLLLLDEPTAALDVHHTEVVFETLHRRAAEGAGVVVVVHDLQLAAAHADEIVLLSDGRVAAHGPPQSVLTAEILTAVYGHELEVLSHPQSGVPLVVPRRGGPPIADPDIQS